MGLNTGTLNKVSFDGVSYDVPADVNVTFNRSKYEVEGQPTTGRTKYKMTLRIPTMESVTLSVTPEELEALNNLSEGANPFPISVTLADGSIYRTVGKINFESYESETGIATVVIIPNKTKDAWTPFLA